MNWSLSNLSLFLTAWLYGQLLWCLFCQPSLNFIIFERVAWIFFKISLFVFHWRNKVKQVWGNNWIRFHFWVNYCYRFTGQKNLFVSEKLQIVQDWQSVKRSKVKSSKVKFYLYITFPNIFSFKAPFLKIGAYKFPSEHSKGNCGKKKKLLLQVLWQGQVFSFPLLKEQWICGPIFQSRAFLCAETCPVTNCLMCEHWLPISLPSLSFHLCLSAHWEIFHEL